MVPCYDSHSKLIHRFLPLQKYINLKKLHEVIKTFLHITMYIDRLISISEITERWAT